MQGPLVTRLTALDRLQDEPGGRMTGLALQGIGVATGHPLR
jgi:hypothetical protein